MNWEEELSSGHGAVDGVSVTWVAIMGLRRLGATTDGRDEVAEGACRVSTTRNDVEARPTAGLWEAL